MPESDYCLTHDPAYGEEAENFSRKGVEARQGKYKPPEVFDSEVEIPQTPQEVKDLVFRAMAQAAAGNMDHNRAKAIAELGRVARNLLKDWPDDEAGKGLDELTPEQLSAEIQSLAKEVIQFPGKGNE